MAGPKLHPSPLPNQARNKREESSAKQLKTEVHSSERMVGVSLFFFFSNFTFRGLNDKAWSLKNLSFKVYSILSNIDRMLLITH
ncbi:hypothetical protein PRUPE_7G014500 [Prunus persica]|uniref:Uncharacterized protein n=1 Tax=Prunus persica TaxID=3760 RepID=A0A251N4X2_PRUPE|nr:hypothetical protein PRUPE_7G014500 [Prunus persica]